MAETRDVVITGVGVVSPIGIGQHAFWDSLMSGRSGVASLTQFDASAMTVRFGAELVDFDPKQHVKPRKALKVMCREIQTAFAAAGLAVESAGITSENVNAERFGAVFGSQMLYGELDEFVDLYQACKNDDGEFQYDQYGDLFPTKMFPLWMLKYLPNMAACHVAIAHDARGPNNTIVLGEASSLLAVSEAASYIQRGMADVMMAGGTGSRLNVTNMLYRGDWDLSKRNDNPSAAMRPFDKDRDGTVNGEGSAVVMLESRRHAERRGAPIMAQLLATHSTVDVGGSKKTTIEAVQRSIEGVMKSGRIDPTSIAHINAHGASTVDDDTMEATAIANVLGDVPVTAPKSYFGSLGAGSGLVELVASVLSLQHGRVPPTLNYKSPDPDCPINVVHQQTLDSNLPVAICLNQSSTGQAVSVALHAAE